MIKKQLANEQAEMDKFEKMIGDMSNSGMEYQNRFNPEYNPRSLMGRYNQENLEQNLNSDLEGLEPPVGLPNIPPEINPE